MMERFKTWNVFFVLWRCWIHSNISEWKYTPELLKNETDKSQALDL